MFDPPPGILFILTSLRDILSPLLLIYGAVFIVQTHFQLALPPWATLAAVLVISVLIWAVRRTYSKLSIRRRMLAMGATPLPRVPDGSFQIVKSVQETFKHGYVGLSVLSIGYVLGGLIHGYLVVD
jgi:hypothetical protein